MANVYTPQMAVRRKKRGDIDKKKMKKNKHATRMSTANIIERKGKQNDGGGGKNGAQYISTCLLMSTETNQQQQQNGREKKNPANYCRLFAARNEYAIAHAVIIQFASLIISTAQFIPPNLIVCSLL